MRALQRKLFALRMYIASSPRQRTLTLNVYYRLVPSARDWVKRVIGHLRKEVHWLGGVLIGGPNEHGIVEFLE